MPRKRFGTIDLDTGELVDGVPIWIGRRMASPYGQKWMQVNQDALAEIAADPDLGLQAWRVFAFLNSRLDFENLIQVPQAEIAAALNMDKAAVSKAIKLLVSKQIILRGPQLGRSSSYRLNPHYGWKGKVKHLRQARQARLQVVETPGPGKDVDTCSEPS